MEEAARSSQEGQPTGSSRGPSQELQFGEEEFEGEGREAGAGVQPRRPKYVSPVDELDESDAEAAQVSPSSTLPSPH